jgi:4-amino-4-deoxy-L-arabinose transferase-like glycosyltransferase
MLLIFSAKTLKDIRIGIVSVLVLCTSYGFVRQHVIKTGDMDAMLVMWTTFYTFLFLHLLLAGKEKQRALIIWTGIGVIGAFLAKGIAGFVPLAGILICAIVERKLKWILTRKETYIIALLGIFITVGYYMLRESLAPGYLSRTLKIDFGRFTTDYMAWHHHPWYYYIRNWYALEFFTPYIFWLPMAVVTGFLIPKYRKAVLLLTIQVVVFIALFSYPKVKLMWYDAPAYPLLSLICAIGFIALWDAVQTRIDKRPVLSHMVFGITLLLIFAIPVKDMYKRNAGLYLPADQLEREGFFIRELKRTRPELKNYKVLMLAEQNAHFTQLDFYLNAYNRHMGYELQHLRDTTEVRAGDTIAVCQEEQMEWLERNFQLELIRENQTGCVLVNVLND